MFKLIESFFENQLLVWTIRLVVNGISKGAAKSEVRRLCDLGFVSEQEDELVFYGWLGDVRYPVVFRFNPNGRLESSIFQFAKINDIRMPDLEENVIMFGKVEHAIRKAFPKSNLDRSTNHSRNWSVGKVGLQLLNGGSEVQLIADYSVDQTS